MFVVVSRLITIIPCTLCACLGLSKNLFSNATEFPLRIWVVDNSGSMTNTDGHRFVETSSSKKIKVVSCTRWAEIKETVLYHAEISALLQAPTVFRLLNPSAGIHNLSIADKGAEKIENDLREIKSAMYKISAAGITPLSRHVREIRQIIQTMSPSLTAEGKRVAVILATDGLPSDDRGMSGGAVQREFVETLRSLEGLPVWVVVRLCTDDDAVVDFYNDLDAQLEMSIEVLDDFESEAKEIYRHNPWLNYTLALHRCRELGYYHRLFDLLDERRLTKGELREFCFLLFGEDVFDSVPDAEADWDGFYGAIDKLVHTENEQWDPIYKRAKKIIHMKALHQAYGESSCVIS